MRLLALAFVLCGCSYIDPPEGFEHGELPSDRQLPPLVFEQETASGGRTRMAPANAPILAGGTFSVSATSPGIRFDIQVQTDDTINVIGAGTFCTCEAASGSLRGIRGTDGCQPTEKRSCKIVVMGRATKAGAHHIVLADVRDNAGVGELDIDVQEAASVETGV